VFSFLVGIHLALAGNAHMRAAVYARSAAEPGVSATTRTFKLKLEEHVILHVLSKCCIAMSACCGVELQCTEYNTVRSDYALFQHHCCAHWCTRVVKSSMYAHCD
jgi:hypothetical protein